ncbi:Hypothetical predicted protein [Podarcis lilfordi]|uniref:Uncharacterized protein n=1 Tax=Podarcis lilfordi TaxID=74358 RepID=A0AA35P518_9SAUR|nr:Hypothetical predicted protein [Podarcis lilfordi]
MSAQLTPHRADLIRIVSRDQPNASSVQSSYPTSLGATILMWGIPQSTQVVPCIQSQCYFVLNNHLLNTFTQAWAHSLHARLHSANPNILARGPKTFCGPSQKQMLPYDLRIVPDIKSYESTRACKMIKISC